MDRGAWWVTVHGVEKSRTRLKQLSIEKYKDFQLDSQRAETPSLQKMCEPHNSPGRALVVSGFSSLAIFFSCWERLLYKQNPDALLPNNYMIIS